VSKILAEKYRSLDAVLAVTEAEFSQHHGIGESIARSVVTGLRDARPLIDDLRTQVSIADAAPKAAATSPSGASGGAFQGLTFVFTGKMATLERKPAEDTVVKLGGTALDAVSKALSYLVVGDLKKPGEKSSKEKAADKHIAAGAALKVISETDFVAMVEAAKSAPVATPQAPTPDEAPEEEPPVVAVTAVSAPPVEVVATPPEDALVLPAQRPAGVLGPVVPPEPAPAPKRLQNKRFVFAGSLATLAQAEATRRVVALGGEVQEQVDGATTHLVVGDKGRAGEKLSEARRLQQGGAGPEILDERAFGALVGVGQMSLFS
jgi:NAD-dependent DNA ligase